MIRFGAGGVLQGYYGGSHTEALRKIYPEHSWDLTKVLFLRFDYILWLTMIVLESSKGILA